MIFSTLYLSKTTTIEIIDGGISLGIAIAKCMDAIQALPKTKLYLSYQQNYDIFVNL